MKAVNYKVEVYQSGKLVKSGCFASKDAAIKCAKKHVANDRYAVVCGVGENSDYRLVINS